MNEELKKMVLRVLEKTDDYQKFMNIVNNITDEEFKENIVNYYNEIAIIKFSISRELFEEFNNKFCRDLSLINVHEIYYYLNYVLVFHKDKFEQVLKLVTSVCNYAGIRKLGICMSNVTKNDLDKYQFSYEYDRKKENSEIVECIDEVINIENKTIEECLDSKCNNEVFCDKCPSSYCLSPNKDEYILRLQNKN